MADVEPPDEAMTPEASLPEAPVEARSLYRHPLAAVGGALVLGGSLVFILMVGIDMTSSGENAYRSLVTYFAVPAVAVVGVILFLLAVRLQVMNARRRGEKVRFTLRIEPSSPRYMRSLWLFLGLGAVILIVTGWAGFKGYETTDSVAFCGETCHTVMGPEDTTYQSSPHAQVLCAECHIGSGASFWVRSKIDGIRQVVKTMTNTYDRPINTPVESLRPAQQTCEQCH
ncbi:MAG TPA: NapC/NirT family cytochrome c, partial [Acidimicrobiia bacterium]|nr:NapC/NirT family cytochrome c [Acidimicrobiia bacterium]